MIRPWPAIVEVASTKHIEAEGFDAARDLSDLFRAVEAGIFWIKPKFGNRPVDDRHPGGVLVLMYFAHLSRYSTLMKNQFPCTIGYHEISE